MVQCLQHRTQGPGYCKTATSGRTERGNLHSERLYSAMQGREQVWGYCGGLQCHKPLSGSQGLAVTRDFHCSTVQYCTDQRMRCCMVLLCNVTQGAGTKGRPHTTVYYNTDGVDWGMVVAKVLFSTLSRGLRTSGNYSVIQHRRRVLQGATVHA